MYHGIDDPGSDVSDARREDAGEQREGSERDGEGFVGGPNQRQGAPAVFEHTPRGRAAMRRRRIALSRARLGDGPPKYRYFTNRRQNG